MKSFKILDTLTDALGSSDGESAEEIKEELRNDGIDVDAVLGRLKEARKNISLTAGYPEHNTDGTICWCGPEVEEYEDGSKLIVHNDFN